VCENSYRDISLQDVSEYWKKTTLNGLKHAGKKPTKKEVERICKERRICERSEQKLTSFLMEQSLLK